jgi:putative transposase
VRWLNNIYFHQALAELPDNTKVRVAYDLSDANQVWVSDLQGRFICEAVWDGNKRAGFPVSMIDALKENRIAGKKKRGQAMIDTADAERGNVIDSEVLQRVPVIPSEPVEQLKRVVIESEFQKKSLIKNWGT